MIFWYPKNHTHPCTPTEHRKASIFGRVLGCNLVVTWEYKNAKKIRNRKSGADSAGFHTKRKTEQGKGRKESGKTVAIIKSSIDNTDENAIITITTKIALAGVIGSPTDNTCLCNPATITETNFRRTIICVVK